MGAKKGHVIPNRMQKGETRNPKGSSAKARALAKVKRLSGDDLADITSLLLTGNRDAIAEMAKSATEPFVKVLTAKLLIDAFKRGDGGLYKTIMERCIGRVKESVELTGANGQPLDVNVTRTLMTLEEKVARADALAAARKAAGDD